MSYFILYFEQCPKSKSSHSQCGVLNIYSVDSEITEGRVPIQYNEINMEASVIASRMDASLFYVFKKPTKLIEMAQRVRGKLFEFIKTRMDLKIESYLFVFDLSGGWPKKIKISEKPIEVSLSNLEEFFKAGVKTGLFKIANL